MTAQWLANTDTKEIHDLENEKIGCKIGEILVEHKRPVYTYEEVKRLCKDKVYNGCMHCMPSLHTG